MFVNLRFISIFDNSLLPNHLSAHCFYHFSTSNVLILRCNNTLIFLWRFQCYIFKLGNLMENPLFKIAFLRAGPRGVVYGGGGGGGHFKPKT